VFGEQRAREMPGPCVGMCAVCTDDDFDCGARGGGFWRCGRRAPARICGAFWCGFADSGELVDRAVHGGGFGEGGLEVRGAWWLK
jgi:hypothetical protein